MTEYHLPRPIRPGLDTLLAQHLHDATMDAMGQAEARVKVHVRQTLRPRLRWAANSPRALRVLRLLRLWAPGTASIDVAYRADPSPGRVVVSFSIAPRKTT
jgi:hypothetical protein